MKKFSESIQMELQTWDYVNPFTISRGTLSAQTVIYVKASSPWGDVHGEGEPHESDVAVASAMYERGVSTFQQWTEVPSRDWLRMHMPADGLRNALDAMLWDLECKKLGVRAWDLAGIAGIEQNSYVETMITIPMDDPDSMAQKASELKEYNFIKLKLGDSAADGLDRDIERMTAVAHAVPHASFVVDANEGWSPQGLSRFVQAAARFNIELIEQPVSGESDAYLSDLKLKIPLAADESCTTLKSLQRLPGLYQWVNIKLDKAGGLTEALEMTALAKSVGLKCMVGCNCGTSLAMASAFVLATQCNLVDLDGPLHLANDREPSIQYIGPELYAPPAALWG